MKIYMKDGIRVTIKEDDQEELEADFGFRDGYVNINSWDLEHKSCITRMIIPKEALIFIEFDETAGRLVVDESWN